MSTPDQQVPTSAPTDAPAAPDQHHSAQHQNAGAATDESSFGGLLSGLRARWDEVQAGFVDDPQQCVQQADRLVSDVVERLTAGFEEARSRLEAQWARGEQASTEDLRLALQRYREFFHKLLSVDRPAGEGDAQPAPAAAPQRTDTPTG